jgi:hypothetical protein
MEKQDKFVIKSIAFITLISFIITLTLWLVYNDLPTENKTRIQKEYKFKELKDSNLTELTSNKRLFYEQLANAK